MKTWLLACTSCLDLGNVDINMKRQIFTLEEIQAVRDIKVATPITGVALYDAPASVLFSALDSRGDGLVKDIGENTEAVIGLEAIAHQLEKSTSATLGSLGARYANIAVEQICDKVNIALEEMPLDIKAYETNSGAAVASGVQSLQETIGSIQQTEQNDLVSLLTVLTSKRDIINKSIRSIYARLGEINENLERIAQLGGDVGPSEQEVSGDTWMRGVCINWNVASTITACSDLKHFLANHSHVYKRLVKKQLDWITDHKDNLLASVNGFNQYSFDPKEYTVVSGNALPGDAVWVVDTVKTTAFGYEASDAMLRSGGILTYPRANERVRMILVAPTLSLEDIRARSAEIKSLLEDIRHWSDVAYVKLWKDAIYDCDVIGHLLTEKAGSLNQRGLTALANVTIDLLHKADGGVGMYALSTVDALLKYVELSLSKYVTHTEEFSK